MATFTTNYNLRKPAVGDLVDVTSDLNASMDTLDTEVFEHETRLGTLELSPAGRMVRKTADEIKNANTTYANDSDLWFPCVAGKIYIADVAIVYSSSSTADIKLRWSLTSPGTGVISVVGSGPDVLVADFQGSGERGAAFPTTGIAYGGNGTTVTLGIRQKVLLTCTGDGGNLRLQWAQNTSDATDTTVRIGSHIEYRVY